MKTEIDLIDFGGGNTGSVRRSLQRLGVSYRDVGPENPPDGTRPLLLPGVGAFGAVMQSLRRAGLDTTLKKLVQSGTPYLGVCVGMQILFDSSKESPDVPGLSLVPGKVSRFRAEKVPQIGWNFIEPCNQNWDAGYVYFVNSFYCEPANDQALLYQAQYGETFCAAVKWNNITAFQFHPEKSGKFGAQLLQRWLADVG